MQKQKSTLTLLVLGGLLIISAAALFFTLNKPGQPDQPTPLPPTETITSQPTPQPPVSSGSNQGTYYEIQRVTLENAKAAFDTKSAVFVDVRAAQAYAAAHIPGALNIPLADITTRLNELDPKQWIITYCT